MANPFEKSGGTAMLEPSSKETQKFDPRATQKFEEFNFDPRATIRMTKEEEEELRQETLERLERRRQLEEESEDRPELADVQLTPQQEAQAERIQRLHEARLHTLLDRFDLGEKLSEQGGSGTVVYEGYDRNLKKDVVIKLFIPESGDWDEEQQENFMREAQLLASLSSPHVVRVYDADWTEYGGYLVMDKLKGENVEQEIEQHQQLSVRDAVDIALQAGQGIKDLHDAGILHRDIKPANIVADKTYYNEAAKYGEQEIVKSYKLVDLGLARPLTGGIVEANPDKWHGDGTPAYISPEAAENLEMTEKSDVWSFGVSIYEMVAGKEKLPFKGETRMETLRQVLFKDAAPLFNDIPEAQLTQAQKALRDLVGRMLQKDPDARLTMEQVLAELERIKGALKERSAEETQVIPEDETYVKRPVTEGVPPPAPAKPQPRRGILSRLKFWGK